MRIDPLAKDKIILFIIRDFTKSVVLGKSLPLHCLRGL